MPETDELTLVCLVRINPSKLPSGMEVRGLPEAISAAVAEVARDAMADDKYYAVKNYTTVRSAVNALAEPFDEIAATFDGQPSDASNALPGGRRAQYLN